MKIQTFVVTGSGPFPIDMLRYDHCYPENQSSASSLDSMDQRQIMLARRIERKSDLPTEGRWNSFGWSIVRGSVVTR